MDARARDIMRTSEKTYKELNLANSDLTDDALIDLMIQHPDLLQRPILEIDDRALLGRPSDRIEAFLDAAIALG